MNGQIDSRRDAQPESAGYLSTNKPKLRPQLRLDTRVPWLAKSINFRLGGTRYGVSVRDVGIATAREPEVRQDAATGNLHLTFRGTSDARSSVDRDTRVRIAISGTQAVRLCQAIGDRLTDEEKRQATL